MREVLAGYQPAVQEVDERLSSASEVMAACDMRPACQYVPDLWKPLLQDDIERETHTFDTRALCWVRNPIPIPVEDIRPEGEIPQPRSTWGPLFEAFDVSTGSTMWSYHAPDFPAAIDEKARLCVLAGYSPRVARVRRVVEAREPVSHGTRALVLTNEEIRARLGLAAGIDRRVKL